LKAIDDVFAEQMMQWQEVCHTTAV